MPQFKMSNETMHRIVKNGFECYPAYPDDKNSPFKLTGIDLERDKYHVLPDGTELWRDHENNVFAMPPRRFVVRFLMAVLRIIKVIVAIIMTFKRLHDYAKLKRAFAEFSEGKAEVPDKAREALIQALRGLSAQGKKA